MNMLLLNAVFLKPFEKGMSLIRFFQNHMQVTRPLIYCSEGETSMNRDIRAAANLQALLWPNATIPYIVDTQFCKYKSAPCSTMNVPKKLHCNIVDYTVL